MEWRRTEGDMALLFGRLMIYRRFIHLKDL